MANAAYDFERFSPNTYDEVQKVSQPPELKVVATDASQKRKKLSAFYSVLTFVVVVTVVSAIIFNNVRLTELTAVYEKTQAEYDNLVETGNRMKVELSEMVSLRTVEERASNDLKMAKAEEYQIEYVDLGTKSQVLKCEKVSENLGDKAKSLWLSAMEYLKK